MPVLLHYFFKNLPKMETVFLARIGESKILLKTRKHNANVKTIYII